MLRNELMQKLQELTAEEFERIAPFLEADLQTLDDLDAIRAEVRRGRESLSKDELLDADDVYSLARKRLAR